MTPLGGTTMKILMTTLWTPIRMWEQNGSMCRVLCRTLSHILCQVVIRVHSHSLSAFCARDFCVQFNAMCMSSFYVVLMPVVTVHVLQDLMVQSATPLFYVFNMISFPLKILNWNVRGLCDDKKCAVIKETVIDSKWNEVSFFRVRQICTAHFIDHLALHADGTRGGIIISWKSSFTVVHTYSDIHSITVILKRNNKEFALPSVYGPIEDSKNWVSKWIERCQPANTNTLGTARWFQLNYRILS